MSMAMIISCKVNGLRVHLATEISDHKLFSNAQMWKIVIKHMIDQKVLDAFRNDLARNQNQPHGIGAGL